MAYLTLPMQEACAVNFISRSNRERHELRLHLPVKRIARIDLGPYGSTLTNKNYSTALGCPFIDLDTVSVEDVREKLPFGYRIEDNGALWYQAGSTIQTHYSVGHDAEMKAMDIPDYFADRDWFPQDDYYQRRGNMLNRKQSGTPNRWGLQNHKGEDIVRPLCHLVLTEDFDTEIDFEEGHVSSRLWNFTIGYEKVLNVASLANVMDEGKVTLRKLFADKVFEKRSDVTYVAGIDAKAILKHGPKFSASFKIPVIEAVKATAGRKVSLVDNDDIGTFGPAHRASTRATGCTGGVSFVATGFNIGKDSITLCPSIGGDAKMLVPRNLMLVHKTAEAWRFVFLISTFFRYWRIENQYFQTMPVFYMIPQYVHRNEVTFTTKSFRGVGVELQTAIWETEGMSMAIHRAMMGLRHELTKRPTMMALRPEDVSSMPPNHRLGFLGRGMAGSAATGPQRIDVFCEDNGLNMDILGDSIYPIVLNSRQKVKLSRANDLLDFSFHGLPDNSLLRNSSKTAPKMTSSRIVRI